MVHFVYFDDKEKVLEKILSGTKTMVVRGAAGRKIPHSRVFEEDFPHNILITCKTIANRIKTLRMLNPRITIDARYLTTALDSLIGSICRDNRIVDKCNTMPINKSQIILKPICSSSLG